MLGPIYVTIYSSILLAVINTVIIVVNSYNYITTVYNIDTYYDLFLSTVTIHIK